MPAERKEEGLGRESLRKFQPGNVRPGAKVACSRDPVCCKNGLSV